AAGGLDQRPIALRGGPRVALRGGEHPPTAELPPPPALSHSCGDDRQAARGDEDQEVVAEGRLAERARGGRRGHVLADDEETGERGPERGPRDEHRDAEDGEDGVDVDGARARATQTAPAGLALVRRAEGVVFRCP